MSAAELASLARHGVPATVVVLDNSGYGTERPMIDGAFNEVCDAEHAAIARAYGFVDAVSNNKPCLIGINRMIVPILRATKVYSLTHLLS